MSGFFTTKATGPDPPGVVTLITKRLVLLTTAGAPPKVTVRPDTKLLPVIVTASPPLGDPVFGDTTLIFGAVETGARDV